MRARLAVIQGQLGTLALMQDDLAEARRRYREALDRFRAMGKEQSEAIATKQLGMVEQERTRLRESRRIIYRDALRIQEAIGDKAEAAKTCNQLAIVAVDAGRGTG